MYLNDLIQSKWKLEKQNEEGDIYVVMKEVSDKTYFHLLCKKIDKEYYDNFEKTYNIKLLPELREFYNNYNGCKLFHSSIVIYGIGVGESKPMDFFINDLNKHNEIPKNEITQEELDDIVFFGGVGDYNLYYKQSELNNPQIYLSQNGNIKPKQQFGSIRELMQFYFKYLTIEYNEKGYRKHPITEKWCRKIPVIANSFNGDIDWEVPTETQEKTR